MAEFYGITPLRWPEEWEVIVGRKNWVATRSAYELAHSWQGAKGFPPAVRKVIRSCSNPEVGTLEPEVCFVEYPTLLDTRKAPSSTDVMVHARSESGSHAVIAVEGKADEPFAEPVSEWLRKAKSPRGSDEMTTRQRRLEFLAGVLSIDVSKLMILRYQLLHRTASAVPEATKIGATSAMVLIHSFLEDDRNCPNWNDYTQFLQSLGLTGAAKDRMVGPILLGSRQNGSIPTYFAWVSDKPKQSQFRFGDS